MCQPKGGYGFIPTLGILQFKKGGRRKQVPSMTSVIMEGSVHNVSWECRSGTMTCYWHREFNGIKLTGGVCLHTAKDLFLSIK